MTGAVAITGVGQVSALGPDVAALAASVREGRCGIGPLTLFAHRGRSSIAAQLASLPSLDVGLEPAVRRRLSRSDHMALAAAGEACRMAGLDASQREATGHNRLGEGSAGIHLLIRNIQSLRRRCSLKRRNAVESRLIGIGAISDARMGG